MKVRRTREAHVNDGFADLRTARDLFRKLEHDRERMARNAMDTYAAFDFFVTAEHLLDWILPDANGASQRKVREARRSAEPLLEITSHLASGAKHFRATAPHHRSVAHADVQEGGFDSASFSPDSFSPAAFALSGLHIELADGTLEHAYSLADRVLAFWQNELGL